MRTDRLPMIARLGTMFERTADVRDQRDLEDVLEDVCRTIAELLGYRAVVVNVYRPAFDDMLTSAAVGSDESVAQLVGKSSPRETWVPLLDERFQRRGAYFVPGGEFDWDGLGVESYVPRIAASEEPDAWTAEDALFVPLRDPKGLLIGVISVDEPDTGRRPTDDELDALVAISRHAALALRIAQDTANDVQHQRMLEGILEVSARLAEAEEPDDILQAVCDGIRDARGPAHAVRSERLGHGVGCRQPRHLARDAFASVHRRVRGRGLLSRPDGGGRGAAGAPTGGLPLGVERPRPARMVAPLAARASGRAAGPHARADLGGRSARPAAAHTGTPPGAAAVRQPGGGRPPVRRPGAEAPPRGHARRAHRRTEPARLPRAAGARGRAAGRIVRADPVRHGQPEEGERHARPRGRRPRPPAAGGRPAHRPPARRRLPPRRRRVRGGAGRRLRARRRARGAPPPARGLARRAPADRHDRGELRPGGLRAGRELGSPRGPGRRDPLRGKAPPSRNRRLSVATRGRQGRSTMRTCVRAIRRAPLPLGLLVPRRGVASGRAGGDSR